MIYSQKPLLLDTVGFILWHNDSPRLSARVRSALLEALSRPIFVSVVTAFEIATKVRLGKLQVPAAILNDFQYVVHADGFRLLELDDRSAVRGGQLAGEHRDPFDRLLAAQALTHNYTLASNDSVFERDFGVEVLW